MSLHKYSIILACTCMIIYANKVQPHDPLRIPELGILLQEDNRTYFVVTCTLRRANANLQFSTARQATITLARAAIKRACVLQGVCIYIQLSFAKKINYKYVVPLVFWLFALQLVR